MPSLRPAPASSGLLIGTHVGGVRVTDVAVGVCCSRVAIGAGISGCPAGVVGVRRRPAQPAITARVSVARLLPLESERSSFVAVGE